MVDSGAVYLSGLSVQTASPRRLVPLLRHYGSLFLGGDSAVAFGDYVSGPNHILPTAGAARATGGLSVHRFLKVTTVQELTQDGAGRGSPPSAVLFDFNGVLVDDEDFHWRAFREIVGPLGVRLSRRRYDARYLVFDDRNALAAMLRDSGIDAPAARLKTLVRRKRALYRRVAAGVRIGGRDAALVRAIARRVPVAVVSGAARREIQAALRRARLTGAIGAVVAAEDVKRPKPAPDGYRLALSRLGLRGGDGCLAIEDAPGGVRAARAAGLTVIGVGTSFTPAALRRAGAARVVPRLGALSVEEVLSTR